MCELLGMSANVPTDICFSFTGLIRRSGDTGPHRDGWGITFYENKGCRTFKDPQPGAKSKIAELVKQYPIKSKTVISHIRRANRGRVCLENTQPFMRELFGSYWTFSHNGQLKNIKRLPLTFYHPVGTTDSEHAFCWILDQIRKKKSYQNLNIKERSKFLRGLFQKLNTSGVFNILLTDSKHLFCYCSTKLFWLTRKAPFGKAKLIDAEVTVNFQKETTPKDIVTVVATQPLTKNEEWAAMKKNQLLVFKSGIIAAAS